MVSANAFPVMGGVETHLHEVTPRLARSGFDVTILATDRTGDLRRRERSDGVTILREKAWPTDRDYYLAPRIYTAIVNGKWDLVHCHGYQTLVPPLAMFAAVRARLPLVVTFHSGGHGSQVRNNLRYVQQLALRPLLARAKRLIAVSDFEAELFPRRLRLPPSRFATIPNGADMASPSDRPLGSGDDGLIVSVGRLERYKGHHRVIAALPHVIARLPQARVRVIGSGPYEAQLRYLARHLGVEQRVEIGSIHPTRRDQMAEALASASLVTLLSEYEANPVAVMEALSLRRRVLVADTSGLSEFARKGLARALPLNADAKTTAQAILEQLRAPLPQPVNLPTWDQCAMRIGEVYVDILRSA